MQQLSLSALEIKSRRIKELTYLLFINADKVTRAVIRLSVLEQMKFQVDGSVGVVELNPNYLYYNV